MTIVATDATATEAGPTTGTFTVSRTGPTTAPLAVTYTVGGTATNGVDYGPLSSPVTIPPGASSAAISVPAHNDSAFERDETVIVTLTASPPYVIGTPSIATVTIVSDDFTDDSLVPGTTPIKAIHFRELRWATDDARTRHGLPPVGSDWTDPILTPGVTEVKAKHLTELRTALTEAYVAAGKPPPIYAESIVARVTIVKASHLSELRMLVRNLE